MAFINTHRFVNGVPRLWGDGGNIREWEFRLESYAASISGGENLKGSKPDNGSEDWERIDDDLRNTIVSTISAFEAESPAVKAAKTAAEVFGFVKARFKFCLVRARMEVYSDFHALSAASFKSAGAFTTCFKTQLAAMEKEGFSTVPLEMVLRFLIALNPVLPVYCRRRRAEIYDDLPVSLDTMIADLLQDSDVDEAFSSAYAVFARARKVKGRAESARNEAKNIAMAGSVCEECRSSHKGIGEVCYTAHPELAPEKWVQRNMSKIIALRQYKESQQQGGGVAVASSSIHAEGGLEHGFTGFSSALHAIMRGESTTTAQAPIDTESTTDTEALTNVDHASDAEALRDPELTADTEALEDLDPASDAEAHTDPESTADTEALKDLDPASDAESESGGGGCTLGDIKQ